MFYIQLFLGQHIDCALFLQRVEKARSEGFTQSQNVNRTKQERDYKRSTKRFIFIHRTTILKQHNQRNLEPSFLQPFCLFFFLLKPTIFLAIHNSSTPQPLCLLPIHSLLFTSFLISFSPQKHRFLHCNSYAFTL